MSLRSGDPPIVRTFFIKDSFKVYGFKSRSVQSSQFVMMHGALAVYFLYSNKKSNSSKKGERYLGFEINHQLRYKQEVDKKEKNREYVIINSS